MVDYKAAARHWEDLEANAKRMPREALLAAIHEFAASHKVCALATASTDGSLVRNTPLEYTWAEGAFWMFSEGGIKFRALEQNKNVCLAIFDADPSFGGLNGMQVTGTAEVLEPFSQEYTKACERKGIPLERLKTLPFVMNIIKVVPTRIDMLCSKFKNDGYD